MLHDEKGSSSAFQDPPPSVGVKTDHDVLVDIPDLTGQFPILGFLVHQGLKVVLTFTPLCYTQKELWSNLDRLLFINAFYLLNF